MVSHRSQQTGFAAHVMTPRRSGAVLLTLTMACLHLAGCSQPPSAVAPIYLADELGRYPTDLGRVGAYPTPGPYCCPIERLTAWGNQLVASNRATAYTRINNEWSRFGTASAGALNGLDDYLIIEDPLSSLLRLGQGQRLSVRRPSNVGPLTDVVAVGEKIFAAAGTGFLYQTDQDFQHWISIPAPSGERFSRITALGNVILAMSDVTKRIYPYSESRWGASVEIPNGSVAFISCSVADQIYWWRQRTGFSPPRGQSLQESLA
jgi:hypothetical protein